MGSQLTIGNALVPEASGSAVFFASLYRLRDALVASLGAGSLRPFTVNMARSEPGHRVITVAMAVDWSEKDDEHPDSRPGDDASSKWHVGILQQPLS